MAPHTPADPKSGFFRDFPDFPYETGVYQPKKRFMDSLLALRFRYPCQAIRPAHPNMFTVLENHLIQYRTIQWHLIALDTSELFNSDTFDIFEPIHSISMN